MQRLPDEIKSHELLKNMQAHEHGIDPYGGHVGNRPLNVERQSQFEKAGGRLWNPCCLYLSALATWCTEEEERPCPLFIVVPFASPKVRPKTAEDHDLRKEWHRLRLLLAVERSVLTLCAPDWMQGRLGCCSPVGRRGVGGSGAYPRRPRWIMA